MKKVNDIILACIFAAVSLTLTAAGLTLSGRRAGRLLCCGVEVTVPDSSSNRFTGAAEVKALLDKEFGKLQGIPVKDINADRIEKTLTSEDCILKCRAFLTSDGILHVRATQRTPVVKLRRGDDLWYADRSGRCISVSDDWCAGLPEIGGLPEPENRQWACAAANMAAWISESGKWADSVDKIHCDRYGELTVELKGRREQFIFGRLEDIERKFRKIGLYLTDIATADKTYGSVNVEYSGQIICKR